MAGILPDEGEALVTQLVVMNDNTDREADLDLVAITNATVSESITAATLTRPTGGGYADIVLTDANWVPNGSSATYPIQTFIAGAGGYPEAVTGYAIITKGTTPRIISIEIDPGGPYTLVETDTYKVTPTITTS